MPNIYNLQHSDSVFCFYNDGVSLFLENSEIENTYQLKSNKQNIESELNGTGDTIWWHNINAGWYHVVISNNHASAETDSILIEEILEPTINLSSDTSICQGESIKLSAYYSNGTIYWDNNVENGIYFVPDTTKTYVATVENQCVAKKDSIKVTVFPQAVLEICNDTTVCMGQEAKVYIIDTSYVSNVYWDNGIENNILFTPTETMICTATAISKFGCDNVTKSIEVTVENHQTSSFVDICDYGNGYEWNGKIYYESGIYPDTLQSQFGCDSVNTLVLNIMPTYDTIFFDTICEGDFVFWQGEVYDANGTYKNFLNNQWGCDSTLTLELTVFRKYETVFESSICEGDTIIWHGEQYFESGSYLDTLQSQWGCDSILIFDLIVNNEYETTIESNICEGDTIIWQGEQYFESGSYLDTLQSQWGCDSILIFDLIVNELPEIHITETNLNDSVILDAGSGFNQYLWSPTGDTTQTIVVLQNDAYTVLVENIYGCQNSETIDVSTIEIQKVSKSEFKIYPNPAKKSITIEGFGNIKIIDLFGKIIISDFQNKKNKVIDISFLEKGVYLITNETLSQTKLFVKE
ncbi:MAG: T9SS type A sorting domain-containing protein [Candidatus Absconditabacteria bacterium]|nr:T9SS type A sorting domain-containing protein [Candidatus Absconditabacteria bacterium]